MKGKTVTKKDRDKVLLTVKVPGREEAKEGEDGEEEKEGAEGDTATPETATGG